MDRNQHHPDHKERRGLKARKALRACLARLGLPDPRVRSVNREQTGRTVQTVRLGRKASKAL